MYLSVLYLFLFVLIFSFSFWPPMLGGERRRPSTLAYYSATVQAPTDPDSPDKAKSSTRLGTLAGVYFQCTLNILDVILFIRLTWIIGTAGIVQRFCLVTIFLEQTTTTRDVCRRSS
jgi:hypothetical protein